MTEGAPNPWRSHHATEHVPVAELSLEQNGYGCFWLFAAVGIVFSEVFVYNWMTLGGREPHPLGETTASVVGINSCWRLLF